MQTGLINRSIPVGRHTEVDIARYSYPGNSVYRTITAASSEFSGIWWLLRRRVPLISNSRIDATHWEYWLSYETTELSAAAWCRAVEDQKGWNAVQALYAERDQSITGIERKW